MNPWELLPLRAPFVLGEDRTAVIAFNQKAVDRVRLHLELLPEPYVGSLTAPVIVLTLNPGYNAADRAVHQRASFRALVRACHLQQPAPYPNYYLNPSVTGGGAAWWARITAPLIREFGVEVVSRNVTSLEYVPYHSERFAHATLRLPSQSYTLSVVSVAMARGAVIFIARGRKLWEAAVPGLSTYHHAYATRSAQNVTISPKNAPLGYRAAQTQIRVAAV